VDVFFCKNEFGLYVSPLTEELTKDEQHFLFELIEQRYDTGSIIFCTQYRQEDWLERLGSNVHAEAILDRIIHNSTWISMGKRNMRERSAWKRSASFRHLKVPSFTRWNPGSRPPEVFCGGISEKWPERKRRSRDILKQ